jgi:hypothetical protein
VVAKSGSPAPCSCTLRPRFTSAAAGVPVEVVEQEIQLDCVLRQRPTLYWPKSGPRCCDKLTQVLAQVLWH